MSVAFKLTFLNKQLTDTVVSVVLNSHNGYCYDIVNNNLLTNRQQEVVEVSIPDYYGVDTVINYINFLTRQTTADSNTSDNTGDSNTGTAANLIASYADFKLADMLCDDNYYNYLCSLFYVQLANKLEESVAINQLFTAAPRLADLLLIGQLTQKYPSWLIRELWLGCPYQLLPHELVSDQQFMVDWLNCSNNKRVEVGRYIYYCKVTRSYQTTSNPKQKELRLKIYKRQISGYLPIVGVVMLLTIRANGCICEILFQKPDIDAETTELSSRRNLAISQVSWSEVTNNSGKAALNIYVSKDSHLKNSRCFQPSHNLSCCYSQTGFPHCY